MLHYAESIDNSTAAAVSADAVGNEYKAYLETELQKHDRVQFEQHANTVFDWANIVLNFSPPPSLPIQQHDGRTRNALRTLLISVKALKRDGTADPDLIKKVESNITYVKHCMEQEENEFLG